MLKGIVWYKCTLSCL